MIFWAILPKNGPAPFDESAVERLLEIGIEAFAQWQNFPDLLAFWWPRFERIARWFVLEWGSGAR